MCGVQDDKFGFTLAEVLITLGIIGVVAVLVIPGMIKNYRAKAYNTHYKVFERKLEEATKQMAIQDKLAPYADTNLFVNAFSKYMKLSKVCNSDNLSGCFSKTIKIGDENVDVSDLSKSKNFGKEDYNTGNVAVHLPDGLTAILSYNPKCDINDITTINKGTDSASCISYILDLNGYAKPNTIGQDIVTIGVEIKTNKNDWEKIPCKFKSSWGNPSQCTKSEIYSDIADSVTNEGLGISGSMGASSNGALMGWDLANKTCNDKGMRLPNHAEFNSLLQAASEGLIPPLQSDEYWLGTGGSDTYKHNCRGERLDYCGSQGTSSHRRVRCIAY